MNFLHCIIDKFGRLATLCICMLMSGLDDCRILCKDVRILSEKQSYFGMINCAIFSNRMYDIYI